MKITQSLSDVAVCEALFTRLELRRKALGLTQAELVERAGTTRPAYRRLNTGTCNTLVLVAVLRELRLLDGLEALVPQQQVRPTEVLGKARSRRVRRTVPSQVQSPIEGGVTTARLAASVPSVASALAQRRKLVVK